MFSEFTQSTSDRNRFKKFKSNREHISGNDKGKIHAMFMKYATYKPIRCNQDGIAESLDQTCWTISRLCEMKKDLNDLKSQLSDKDLSLWHRHTSTVSLSGNIVFELKRRFSPELCTQAWSKFYEILSTYLLVDVPESNLITIHLCEGPGAFVTALNHYIKLNYPTKNWHWYASTLNPYYEGNQSDFCIMDDRLIQHTLDNWEFGSEDNGDLIHSSDLVYRLNQRLSPNKAHIVTADGSINCQRDPAEQESLVFSLICSEVAAALNLLVIGGSFVLKLFTMFEANTVCLMYLLNLLFEQVNVFKPASSKAGNSEVYVICKGFRDGQTLCKAIIEKLKDQKDKPFASCMLPRTMISDEFISDHTRIAQLFCQLQRQTIEENLRLFADDNKSDLSIIKSIKACCAEYYIKHYGVRAIKPIDKIVKGLKLEEQITISRRCTKLTGSFLNRKELAEMSVSQKMADRREMVITTTTPHILEGLNTQVTVITHLGQPIDRIYVTCFADIPLLQQTISIIQDIKDCLYVPHNNLLSRSLFDAISWMADVSQSITCYCIGETSLLTATREYGAMISVKQFCLSEISDEDLVYIDVTSCKSDVKLGYLDMETSTSYKLEMLKCFIAIKVLPLSCSVILKIRGSLTRFSSGFLFVLREFFQEIRLFPFVDEFSPGFLLACREFKSVSDELASGLSDVSDKLSNTASGDLTVLTFISTQDLLRDSKFVEVLNEANNHVLRLTYNAWLTVYNQSGAPDTHVTPTPLHI